ncbi:hypothetical protein YB2330_002320 [Saitoella coloradoensis]
MAVYGGMVYGQIRRDVYGPNKLPPSSLPQASWGTRSEVSKPQYDQIAEEFDASVEGTEKWTGINLLRWWIMRKAYGNVLESGCGTGRNIDHLPLDKMESVTFIDQSEKMLNKAKEHWKRLYPKKRYIDPDVMAFVMSSGGELPPKEKETDPEVCFMPMSVEEMPVPDHSSPENQGFDTIIQTFAVCSHPDPPALLNHLTSLVAPSGQILLIEHGASHYKWLNDVLDRYAPAHAEKWGCWWNRDIGKVLEESNMVVESVERWHLGTTWVIKGRAKKADEK